MDVTTKSGTSWQFVEAGCQWRNGLVERQVQSLKKTLTKSVEFSSNLNFAELDSLFSSVANIVNSRPLAVESFGQDNLRCITPNDLLLGRTRAKSLSAGMYANSDDLPVRLQFLEDLETLWWEQWLREVFPSLLPFRKWKAEFRNLQVGDIVLVMYIVRV